MSKPTESLPKKQDTATACGARAAIAALPAALMPGPHGPLPRDAAQP